jgi:cytochrome P450
VPNDPKRSSIATEAASKTAALGSFAPAPVGEEEDPFELFNRITGAGIVRDPYPDFAAQRAGAPVQPLDLRTEYAIPDDMEIDLPPAYRVLGYDEVVTVLRDGDTFSSAGYSVSMGEVMGHSILEMDEPEHHRYRSLVQQAFTRKAMERWETELVGPIVDGFIDSFAARGRADLVRELTFPFPVHVIAGLLGLQHEDLPQFHRWAVELISIGADWDRAVQASKNLGDYFAGILAERRRQPADDVISVLAGAELDGQRLTDDDIFAFLRLLLPAGAETTYRSSSNLILGLLTRPEQLDAVRADRSLVPQAIEEGLRWEPPLTGIMRTAVREVELGGVTVPAGAMLSVTLGAANHDPDRWDEPERFDVFRDPQQHMAFAFGPHMCLGIHLARMETTVVLNKVLDRLPGLRLDPDADDVHITGMTFRSPASLPVLFDAA